MAKDLMIRSSTEEFITFKVQEKDKGIQVRYENENLWMTQKAMAELFDCSTDNISLHLKNIFKENELDSNSVTEEFSTTASDGKKYKMKFYNLDAIISVGYRVNSKRATQFRRWATQVLKTFTIQGYVLDKKSDVIIAKNYLNKQELEQLELIVTAFLDLAEARARRHIPMTMEDWATRIDKFLLSDDRDILKDAGKISHEIACDKALTEFEKYRIKQDRLYKSDFDLLLEKVEKEKQESKNNE